MAQLKILGVSLRDFISALKATFQSKTNTVIIIRIRQRTMGIDKSSKVRIVVSSCDLVRVRALSPLVLKTMNNEREKKGSRK
jgi:hypothetical protein